MAFERPETSDSDEWPGQIDQRSQRRDADPGKDNSRDVFADGHVFPVFLPIGIWVR